MPDDGGFSLIAGRGQVVSFKAPGRIAFDGAHIWIADLGAITELNASDGTRIRTVPDADGPSDIAFDGTHIWIANYGGGSLTELTIG